MMQATLVTKNHLHLQAMHTWMLPNAMLTIVKHRASGFAWKDVDNFSKST